MSGWTEDRVDLCKTLWAQGLSASQIAKRLGGVTRNAVIGKVHRLGLAPRAPRSRAMFRDAKILSLFRPTRRQLNTPPGSKTNRKNVTSPRIRLVKPVVELPETPEALRVDLLDLREDMCRWPIGDPKKEGFHFCGRQCGEDFSYCGFHEAIAHHPKRRTG